MQRHYLADYGYPHRRHLPTPWAAVPIQSLFSRGTSRRWFLVDGIPLSLLLQPFLPVCLNTRDKNLLSCFSDMQRQDTPLLSAVVPTSYKWSVEAGITNF
jgi:hypothetical protein